MEHSCLAASNLTNLQTWEGIISREVPREDHTQMEKNLFTPTETQLNESKRLIANKDGMRLAIDHHDMQQEIRVLRMSILDEWSGYPANKDRRNHTAHGGNLTGDMEAIDYMSEWNLDRANAWKKSFTEYYGVEFEYCVARQIRFSYWQLLDALNILASVKALYKWRTRARKADREAIISKCSSIVEAWKSGATGLFDEGSPLLLEYQEMMRIYYA